MLDAISLCVPRANRTDPNLITTRVDIRPATLFIYPIKVSPKNSDPGRYAIPTGKSSTLRPRTAVNAPAWNGRTSSPAKVVPSGKTRTVRLFPRYLLIFLMAAMPLCASRLSTKIVSTVRGRRDLENVRRNSPIVKRYPSATGDLTRSVADLSRVLVVGL
jgi:hypothetical protein